MPPRGAESCRVAILLCGVFCIAMAAHAADGDYVWAKQMGGSIDDVGKSVAVDSSGNVYTTGYFRGTVDFDPGAGTANLTSMGNNDIFVSKLNSAGAFVWAKQLGGSNSESGNSITVDSSGNVYTTGYFQGTADFDPGAGTYNLTAVGELDIFVSKMDSTGAFIWAKKMGGDSYDAGEAIAVDSGGNVYTTGEFAGTVDFDPGAGTANLTAAYYDIFVSKLDSTGALIWARQMGGSGNDRGHSIAVDSSGNVYTTGYFGGTADFDPGAGTANLISAGFDDIFVSKLDSTGAFIWAKKTGGSDFDAGQSVAVDAGGNVYTTGSFAGTVDFDPGAGTANLTGLGSNDIFVSKLDSSGAFVWAKQMGGSDPEYGYSVALDSGGNVYTTGYYYGTGDFDPGAGTANLTSMGGYDIFVSKLDSSGAFVWAKQLGGSSLDFGISIAVDSGGNVYTTGYFQGTGDFDPGAGTANLTSMGGYDIFLSKLSGPPPPSVTSVTRANASPTNDSSVNYSVVFDQSVTGVDATDFALTVGGVTGAAVTGISGSGATYTVTVDTGTGDGTIRLDVADNDSIVNGNGSPLGDSGAGNGDYTSGEVYTIDKSAPTAALSSPASDPTNSAFAVDVVLSESSTNLDAGDVTPTNASISGFSGSGTSYSFTLTPLTDGAFSAAINAGAFTDAVGNGNIASNVLSRTYDSEAPTVSLSSLSSNPTNASPIAVTVSFSESVTGFTSGDVVAGNGAVNNFAGSGASYTFDLTPSGQGAVTADIAGSVCTDATGNGNTAAAQFVRTYDSVAPAVSLSSLSSNPTNASPIAVTVAFSESVTGFTSGDVVAGNGAVSNFAGSGASYSFELTPSGQGAVTADIAGGVCADAAGNGNTAATQFVRTYDTIAPTVTIGAPSSAITAGGTVTYTVAYGGADSVTLADGDVTVTPTGTATATAAVTGAGNFSRTVTLSGITGNGTLGISIAAGTAGDTAGNTAGAAGPSAPFQVDNTSAGLSIGAPSALTTNGDPVSYTVTYTNITNVTLAAEDVSLVVTGVATADVVVDVAKVESTQQRTVTLENITGNGTLSITIAAGTGTDDLGLDAPGAGPSATFVVDTASPGVESIALVPAKGLMQDYLVTFSEPVGGVDVLDFTLTTTGSITGAYVVSVTGTAYSATWTVTVDTGTGEGSVRLDVIDNDTITDEAGNTLGGPGLNNGDFTAGEVFGSEPASLPALGLYGMALLALTLVALYSVRRYTQRA